MANAEVTTLFPTSAAALGDGRVYTELGKVTVIAHEAIHQFLGATNPKKEDKAHNMYSQNMQVFTDILTEYSEKNNLGLTKDQIRELGLYGQPEGKESEAFKIHINKLAEKNGTSYDDEKKEYKKRMEVLMYKPR